MMRSVIIQLNPLTVAWSTTSNDVTAAGRVDVYLPIQGILFLLAYKILHYWVALLRTAHLPLQFTTAIWNHSIYGITKQLTSNFLSYWLLGIPCCKLHLSRSDMVCNTKPSIYGATKHSFTCNKQGYICALLRTYVGVAMETKRAHNSKMCLIGRKVDELFRVPNRTCSTANMCLQAEYCTSIVRPFGNYGLAIW